MTFSLKNFLKNIQAFSFLASILSAQNLQAENWEQSQTIENLYQTVGRLTLEVDSLKGKNDELEKRIATLEADIVELKKLPSALELHKSECQAALQNCKQELMQKMPAKPTPTEAPSSKQEIKNAKSEPMQFSENYPKEGIIYTVKPGDTLSKIAQEQHSTVTDLQNANKIADPKMLQAGQELFVPIAE